MHTERAWPPRATTTTKAIWGRILGEEKKMGEAEALTRRREEDLIICRKIWSNAHKIALPALFCGRFSTAEDLIKIFTFCIANLGLVTVVCGCVGARHRDKSVLNIWVTNPWAKRPRAFRGEKKFHKSQPEPMNLLWRTQKKSFLAELELLFSNTRAQKKKSFPVVRCRSLIDEISIALNSDFFVPFHYVIVSRAVRLANHFLISFRVSARRELWHSIEAFRARVAPEY